MEPETVEGHGHGVKWTLERYASESSQVPTHLETPRESTLVNRGTHHRGKRRSYRYKTGSALP